MMGVTFVVRQKVRIVSARPFKFLPSAVRHSCVRGAQPLQQSVFIQGLSTGAKPQPVRNGLGSLPALLRTYLLAGFQPVACASASEQNQENSI